MKTLVTLTLVTSLVSASSSLGFCPDPINFNDITFSIRSYQTCEQRQEELRNIHERIERAERRVQERAKFEQERQRLAQMRAEIDAEHAQTMAKLKAMRERIEAENLAMQQSQQVATIQDDLGVTNEP